MIEQIQLEKMDFKNIVPLTLNHSIKELFWVVQHKTIIQESTNTSNIDISNNVPTDTHFGTHSNDYLNYSNSSSTSFKTHLYLDTQYDHFDTCKLVVNGIDRFDPQPAAYFRTIR